MKELITISALSLLLAAGCASRQTGRGGADDTTGTMSQDKTEAVHPGTALGTNPSEDPSPPASPRNGTDEFQTRPRGGSPNPGTGSGSGSGSSFGPGSEDNPDEPSSGDSLEPGPHPLSPDSANPDESGPDIRPLDNGPQGSGQNEEGPGMFNLHRIILMLRI